MTWTAWDEPAAESAAAQLLEGLRDQVLKAWGRLLEGVLVVGGFGRGEGGLLRTRLGSFRPWNDVDLVLLLRPGAAPPDGWHAQTAAWAAHWGLDGVDLAWVALADWRSRPRSLFHLETRAGHRVLWGSGEAVTRLPLRMGAGDCLREAHRLLANRGFPLLMVALPELQEGGHAGPGFKLNAVLKARMVLGDARLLAACRLPLRYAERPAALRALGAPAEVLEGHAEAVERKLRPTEEWAAAACEHEVQARDAARSWLEHGPLALAGTDAAGYPAYVAGRLGSWRRRVRLAVGGGPAALEMRDRLDASLPLLLAGLAGPPGWDPAPLAKLWPGVVPGDAVWSAAAVALGSRWLEGK